MTGFDARGTDATMTIPHSRRRSAAPRALLALLGSAALTSPVAAQPAATPAPVLESEEAFVHKLPAASPHWSYIRGGFDSGGTRIFNGDTGKMLGMINTSKWSDLGLDPTGKFHYVSETIWTKVLRGTRQDLVAVYDPVTLDLVAEIPMPGRLLIGSRINNFVISDDGKTGYIYNLSPASSVNVVDFAKRKFVQTVELPGCASLLPNPGVGFSALCGDGTLATVALSGKTPTVTHTAPFFSATNDPIFDNFAYNRGTSEATFVSYTGLIYQAKIAATPVVAAPWSIQAAAGLRVGETKPLDINWLPGGRQPMALHRATGRLYVLMHKGEYWSHKDPGTEIWVVDLAARKVVRRVPLKKPAENIEVTQDDKPLLFINGDEDATRVLDATSYEQKFDIEHAGGGLIAVAGAR